MGTLLLKRDEAIPAARWLEAAVWSHPDHVPSYIKLGKAYFLAGLPELALAAFEEARRLDPFNVAALDNLAILRDADGTRDDAAPQGQPGDAGNDDAPGRQDAAAADGPRPDPGADLASLREMLGELPHIAVELRAGRPAVTGWTRGPQERALLERILSAHPEILDLTTDDTGDPQRMVEVDATIFVVTALERTTTGFDFLQLVQFNYDYFTSGHTNEGFGFIAPGFVGPVTGESQSGWMLSAAVDYDVTIANAVDERVAILARPHLTTLSGTPATFIAGGELVFSVSGNISGDIKPYPFGTTLTVTPTLLRTPGEDGSPRVHLTVQAGRTSVLELLAVQDLEDNFVAFDKVNVTAEAVLGFGRTLILSGLSQKERRTGDSGVPVLGSIPLIKYLFSSSRTLEVDTAVIILLTPRDPAYTGEQNRADLEEFVERRRALVAARQGTEEDWRRFTEQHPDWADMPPNRFASHFFLMANSEIYRVVSGHDIEEAELDFDPLGTEMEP